MALFDRPTHSHVTALLRQGFAARLRSETANIYLSQQTDIVTLTRNRQDASIFFFCGGDGPLTAILVRPPEKGQPKFLSIGAENVTLTDNPTLLKLTLSDISRQLWSMSRVAPTAYLSLRHVSVNSSVNSRSALSKWELFHLEVMPNTIGRGFVEGPFQSTQYMKLSQGVSHALLELGVRFRLRSVHGRVLRRCEKVIRQDGPKSPIASTHDDELLITAFRSSENCSDAISADYALKDITSGEFLNILPSGLKLVGVETKLCLRASPNGWGTVSVGTGTKNELQWLMAGSRGRLEMRRNPGAWETFTMEFVRQSYDAAIRELPVPGIYKVAETATRQNLRREVEERVAAVRRKSVSSREETSKKKKTFDHSKALAGLSDSVPETTKKAKPDERKKTAVTKAARDDTASKAARGQKGMKASASAGALPRNKANRKASKKNRKKQKPKSANGTPSTNVSKTGSQSVPAASANHKTEKENRSQEARSNADSDMSPNVAPSSSPETMETSRGPPCAACGRPLVGTYTTALGKSFHPECFCCGRCRRPMGVGAGQFRERGGIPYCTSCYATHLASRCARCSQPIMETVVTAMERTWHKDCLTCTICRLPLTQTFWLYADKPNEPRCSRCVTGDEHYSSVGGSRRMLNLPKLGGRSNNVPSFPLNGSTNGSNVIGDSSKSGRIRLMAPILPPTTKR